MSARRTSRRSTAEVPKGAVGLADLERWSARGARVQVEGPGRLPEDPVSFVVSFVLIGVTLMLVARLRAGVVSGGKKFEKVAEDRQLTLADVGGAKEARADLQDIIWFLKDPTRFKKMGARCPAGVLLVGPPGTGKTLLARAVAGEAGVPVLVASGSEFGEMYVGVGARRVRDLASKARHHGRCIIFIDEFDSIGGKRGRPNRTSEEDLTLNQLLVEMDGMAGSEGIVWMAATNREDMLDPAVRRPGRFDRVVEVGMPTAADRLEILKVHASKRPLDADVDLQELSTLTVGYSGAELANLLNEAAIIAVHAESAGDHACASRPGARQDPPRPRAGGCRRVRRGAPADRAARGRSRDRRTRDLPGRSPPQGHHRAAWPIARRRALRAGHRSPPALAPLPRGRHREGVRRPGGRAGVPRSRSR